MGLDMSFYVGAKLSAEDIKEYNEVLIGEQESFKEATEGKDLSWGEYDDERNAHFEEYVEKAGDNFKRVDDILEGLEPVEYFRKHSGLHGYIGENFGYMTGGEDNCTYFVLGKEDLLGIKELAEDSLKGDEVQYSGFFWGESIEEDWEDTIKFVDKMLDDLDFEKESVYYSAWY